MSRFAWLRRSFFRGDRGQDGEPDDAPAAAKSIPAERAEENSFGTERSDREVSDVTERLESVALELEGLRKQEREREEEKTRESKGGEPKAAADGSPRLSDFTMLRVVGKGSFGKVILVRKKGGADDDMLYAMKVLKKKELVKRRQILRTKTERLVLGTSTHPFITKLHYAFQNQEKLYMVMDFCAGGELFFHLSRYRRFPERVAKFFAAELTLALEHLHSRDVIYRDLKPENVFLQANGHIKLGDFGLAKSGVHDASSGATSMCGTPEYMAPEVLNKSGHGKTVDWWGLGMLTYEMLTGLPPWYTRNRSKLFYRLRHSPLKVPTYMSRTAAIFIAQLLNRDPSMRLGAKSAEEVKSQEFFSMAPGDWEALANLQITPPIRPMDPRPNGDGAQQADGAADEQLSAQNFDPQFARLALSSSVSVSSDPGSSQNGGSQGNGSRPTTPVVFDDFSYDGTAPGEAGSFGKGSRGNSGSSSSEGFWDAELDGKSEKEGVQLQTPRGSVSVTVVEELDPPSDDEDGADGGARTRIKSQREDNDERDDAELETEDAQQLLDEAFQGSAPLAAADQLKPLSA